MTVSADFLAYVEELLAGLGSLRTKRMFGGVGLYLGDVFFALIDDDVIYLKADDQTRPKFEAASSRPFSYHKGGEHMVTNYLSLPEAALEDPEAAADWARLALQAAMRKRSASKG